MSVIDDRLAPGELAFLPLGGAGEIGMNLNLYGFHDGVAETWIIADLGMTFADESLPGIDIVVPDTTFIEARRDRLAAIVLTHAHEDHLGAVHYLWERLRAPVYATPFAAAVLRGKLGEVGLADEVPLNVVESTATFEIGPFRLAMIAITHSTPEAQALAIETDAGIVIHSGDWKLDPTPLLGPSTDLKAFGEWAGRGVLAFVCDSTNAIQPGRSGSEADVRENLLAICAGRPGRIAITTFSSNIARIETVAAVAEATGRHLVLVGRSLKRFTEVARDCGYLGSEFTVLDEGEAGYLPRDKVLYLCTGCQGEPRGAMARIAAGEHRDVVLESGDLVIFSAKIIPGNERSIGRLHNRFARAGVEVITERDAFVHVSGHPRQDELAAVYDLLKPKIAVPVHGEARHLRAHADFARGRGVAHAFELENGALLKLAPGRPEIIGQTEAGRLAVDGVEAISADDPSLQARRRMMYNGVACASLLLDPSSRLAAPPRVSLIGVVGSATLETLTSLAVAAVAEAVAQMRLVDRSDNDRLAETARVALRRTVRRFCDRRPVTEIHIARLSGGQLQIDQGMKETAL